MKIKANEWEADGKSFLVWSGEKCFLYGFARNIKIKKWVYSKGTIEVLGVKKA